MTISKKNDSSAYTDIVASLSPPSILLLLILITILFLSTGWCPWRNANKKVAKLIKCDEKELKLALRSVLFTERPYSAFPKDFPQKSYPPLSAFSQRHGGSLYF